MNDWITNDSETTETLPAIRSANRPLPHERPYPLQPAVAATIDAS